MNLTVLISAVKVPLMVLLSLDCRLAVIILHYSLVPDTRLLDSVLSCSELSMAPKFYPSDYYPGRNKSGGIIRPNNFRSSNLLNNPLWLNLTRILTTHHHPTQTIIHYPPFRNSFQNIHLRSRRKCGPC